MKVDIVSHFAFAAGILTYDIYHLENLHLKNLVLSFCKN